MIPFDVEIHVPFYTKARRVGWRHPIWFYQTLAEWELETALLVCVQAVASNSASSVPAISVNGLIRYRMDFKQRMQDLRVYRQLKREEDLLRRYGGQQLSSMHLGCCQDGRCTGTGGR